MTRIQIVKRKTPQELGRMLYDETYNVTKIYYDQHAEKETIDKQLWAWLHLGFIAGLKACGYTEEECNAIIDITQEHLKSHQARYEAGLEKNQYQT